MLIMEQFTIWYLDLWWEWGGGRDRKGEGVLAGNEGGERDKEKKKQSSVGHLVDF